MDKKKQEFQLGDIAYMIDDDYNFFEGIVYRMELCNDGKIEYSAGMCDFTSNDIGDWVFESELFRGLHMESLFEIKE